MPQSAVHLSPELLDACRRATVLTPTERLRRALAQAYDLWMSAQGHAAWPSIEAFSLDGWLSHQYRLWRDWDPQLPRLLDGTAELLLWQATAPDGHEALAPLARDAWAVARQWRLPVESHALGRTENGRLFHRWARRFDEALRDTGSISRAELPDRLTRLTSESAVFAGNPERLCGFGFEATPTAVLAHLRALEARGTSVRLLNDPGVARPRCIRVELPDPRAELSAAAQWCRDVLLGEPDACIGVVVPDLTRRFAAVERQFAAWLEPVGRAGPGHAFDLSGGRPLAEQAVWRDAVRWLRLCFHRLSHPEARRLLASPFLTLPALQTLPARLPETFGLPELAMATGDAGWLRLLRACAADAVCLPLEDWLARFQRALERVGWTGRGAGSVQFQARERAVTLFQDAGRARAGQLPCDAAAALTRLEGLARQCPFAPERRAAPVQILGYLETTGLRFTHLWVTGLADEAWPGPVQTNPLLPLSLQRELGVPRVDPGGELAFARRRLEHWRQCADTVVLSHGVEEQAAVRGPSPLTAHLDAVPVAALIHGHQAVSHPAIVPRGTVLVGDSVERTEPPAPPSIRGGSQLLRDQALCPFRRWALHTLRLTPPQEPHAFPDARDRGVLVHDVLHRALLGPGDRPVPPAAMDPAVLDAAIAAALDTRYARFPAAVRAEEHRRLSALLERWLAAESARTPFAVHALEHDVQVTVGGITLNLRFDRVDRVNGALVVLDYKTGPTRPQGLFDQRLVEPQLPLYALADPSIQGVLFVVLDGDVALRGAAASGLDLAPARLTPVDDWEALRRQWRQRLTVLAEEILAGQAQVAPVGPEACRICHLQPFCRIHEHPAGP